MNKRYNNTIVYNLDMIPAAATLTQASETQLKKFSFGISQDIINPANDDMTIKRYRESLFKERLSSIQEATKNINIDKKYFKYLLDITSKFDNFNFTDVYIRESQNELWIVNKYMNDEISTSFFETAFKVWDNIFIDVDVLFIGEEELNRECIPNDVIQIPILVGVR